jgi:hypothetical protein
MDILERLSVMLLGMLGVIVGAGLVLVVTVCIMMIVDYRGTSRKINEHDELLAWLLKEYGRFAPEMKAVLCFLSGYDVVKTDQIEIVRGLIDQAPRRMANDLRMMLYEYDQWKAKQ